MIFLQKGPEGRRNENVKSKKETASAEKEGAKKEFKEERGLLAEKIDREGAMHQKERKDEKESLFERNRDDQRKQQKEEGRRTDLLYLQEYGLNEKDVGKATVLGIQLDDINKSLRKNISKLWELERKLKDPDTAPGDKGELLARMAFEGIIIARPIAEALALIEESPGNYSGEEHFNLDKILAEIPPSFKPFLVEAAASELMFRLSDREVRKSSFNIIATLGEKDESIQKAIPVAAVVKSLLENVQGDRPDDPEALTMGVELLGYAKGIHKEHFKNLPRDFLPKLLDRMSVSQQKRTLSVLASLSELKPRPLPDAVQEDIAKRWKAVKDKADEEQPKPRETVPGTLADRKMLGLKNTVEEPKMDPESVVAALLEARALSIKAKMTPGGITEDFVPIYKLRDLNERQLKVLAWHATTNSSNLKRRIVCSLLFDYAKNPDKRNLVPWEEIAPRIPDEQDDEIRADLVSLMGMLNEEKDVNFPDDQTTLKLLMDKNKEVQKTAALVLRPKSDVATKKAMEILLASLTDPEMEKQLPQLTYTLEAIKRLDANAFNLHLVEQMSKPERAQSAFIAFLTDMEKRSQRPLKGDVLRLQEKNDKALKEAIDAAAQKASNPATRLFLGLAQAVLDPANSEKPFMQSLSQVDTVLKDVAPKDTDGYRIEALRGSVMRTLGRLPPDVAVSSVKNSWEKLPTMTRGDTVSYFPFLVTKDSLEFSGKTVENEGENEFVRLVAAEGIIVWNERLQSQKNATEKGVREEYEKTMKKLEPLGIDPQKSAIATQPHLLSILENQKLAIDVRYKALSLYNKVTTKETRVKALQKLLKKEPEGEMKTIMEDFSKEKEESYDK